MKIAWVIDIIVSIDDLLKYIDCLVIGEDSPSFEHGWEISLTQFCYDIGIIFGGIDIIEM